MRHGCGLQDAQNGQTEDHLRCWGVTSPGETVFQDPMADYGRATVPSELIEAEVVAVSSGVYHTCAVRKDDGAMACWGYPDVAEIPADLQELEFSSVSVSRFTTCGVTTGIRVKCWGPEPMNWPGTTFSANTFYFNQHKVPERHADEEFVDLSASVFHVCATRPDGTVACWAADAVPDTPETGIYTGLRIINTGQAWVPPSLRARASEIPEPAEETPVPLPTSATRILRIEPSIRSVSLKHGELLWLSVQVYGRQDLRDDTLGDRSAISFEWSSERFGSQSYRDGGRFVESASDSVGRACPTCFAFWPQDRGCGGGWRDVSPGGVTTRHGASRALLERRRIRW